MSVELRQGIEYCITLSTGKHLRVRFISGTGRYARVINWSACEPVLSKVLQGINIHTTEVTSKALTIIVHLQWHIKSVVVIHLLCLHVYIMKWRVHLKILNNDSYSRGVHLSEYLKLLNNDFYGLNSIQNNNIFENLSGELEHVKYRENLKPIKVHFLP